MPSLISIEHLTKIYRRGAEEIKVLQDLVLEVPEGEYVALMVQSG